MENLESRIAQLELNQRRLAILTIDASEKVKAFDRACLRYNLTFDQEARARQAIVEFLESTSTDLKALVGDVEEIVGSEAAARDVISGFKARGTARERWDEIGSTELL
ncbi:hypothetical protein [Corynebacterium liangguodongii]|uniref:Uncharacterized protein n=1 Tax=Corynebacterium liangguodongii TaxID=2079535 RepID=A0A2S0WET0_9CORY|nr:hypothetical protein [Corynebacterium liangguodongii]AWB84266.1 hypothetical protein C3E79_07055 [Corynebacterium liangguodongii]PWC00275.1 hypothetical protein DF219_03690 [Corynebacterium liangguodongii]